MPADPGAALGLGVGRLQRASDPSALRGVPAKTLIELLCDAATRCPDRPVLIFEDGLTVTRRQLRDLVERFACHLRRYVSPHQRVAIVMDNRAEFMAAFLAVVANRAAVVPVNPESGQADAHHVLSRSGAAVAIVDEGGRELINALAGTLPNLRSVISLDGQEPDGLPTTTERLDLSGVSCRDDDIVAVTFTSGTTGMPKGCMVDHVWALRIVDVAHRIHRHGPNDRIFNPVKFHYLDSVVVLLRALECDGAFIAVRKFSVGRFWEIVRRHDVTTLATVASVPLWLLKTEPSSLDKEHKVRLAIQAHVPSKQHVELDRRWGFPWLENYGMMEAGVIARVPLYLSDELRGSGSVGPPVPGMRVRIVDEDGQELETGTAGEIIVKGPGMFRGYQDDAEATSALVRDGWIYTGDLGRVDERGFVYVVGRKKDVIRRSGENVSAAEVEAVLRLIPSVLDAAVVPIPDEDRDEEIKAYVQFSRDGHSIPQPEEVASFCAARLAPHKVPRYIEYVADFPRTPSMRIRKSLLGAQPSGRVWDRKEN